MSNCDFYAANADALAVLGFVFGETDCRVFELSSAPGRDLQEFSSASDVAAAFDLGRCVGHETHSALLQLYSPGTQGPFSIRRIELSPEKCNGHTFRYEPNGWGLIQLYFGGVSGRGLHHSHTNHNSERRARKWASTYDPQLGDVGAWDWGAVSRISRKINYHIRNRLAVGKHGSRPVLADAQRHVEDGCELLLN